MQHGPAASSGSHPKAPGSAGGYLLVDKRVPPQEILILVRSDHNGLFTAPIKEALGKRGIPFSDPSEVKELLANDGNRRALSLLRLFVHREDSLAWASLLRLTAGIGQTFFDYIYERARARHGTFGAALLEAHQEEYPYLSRTLTGRATDLITDTLERMATAEVPHVMPEQGWGKWIAEFFGDGSDAQLSDEFRELLAKIDARVEPVDDPGRYLGQITPIAKDIALEKSDKVRIMTLAGAKGLTVKATIIAGLETGFIPMDGCDPAEERRLLFVGMTRAEEFLYGTWARRRRGPTARMGRAQVDDRRQLSNLVGGGPVESKDGPACLDRMSSV
jgi:superfamily I DNA/RNA helicase